jgi:hypothetical protein
MSLPWLRPRTGTGLPPVTVPSEQYPEVMYEVGFTSQPLDISPAWFDLSDRLRVPGGSIKRGRSYEFDRQETGTLAVALDNRDSALSPENSASAYYPLRSTRPARVTFVWDDVSYSAFYGISEGYPQDFPGLGFDALVSQQASDYLYALNNSRFTPGQTTLLDALPASPQNTEEWVHVASISLPLPQVAPFTITVAGLTSEWPTEEMEVLEIYPPEIDPHWYFVRRTSETTYEHPVGAAVTTEVVNFEQAYSGERIRQVLESVGFDSGWYDLDEGQSLIAPSENLANASPLEHINLIAEAEFGRFFVDRAGFFRFKDRHAVIVENLTPVLTFRDVLTPTGTEANYRLEGPLEHSEEKLYNRVRITIQGGDYDGQIVDVADQASIDEHFERIFERTYPYALLNDAESAAAYVLARNSEDTLRIPGVTVFGAREPSRLWPLLLGRELGERVRFRMQPKGGGDEVDKDMVIEGISHAFAPGEHVVTFECSEVDATQYWILGLPGYSELGVTTRIGF